MAHQCRPDLHTQFWHTAAHLDFSVHRHPSTCTLLCALCLMLSSPVLDLLFAPPRQSESCLWTSSSPGLFHYALHMPPPPCLPGLQTYKAPCVWILLSFHRSALDSFFFLSFFCFAGLTWRETRLAGPSVCRAAFFPFFCFAGLTWRKTRFAGSSVCRGCIFLFYSSLLSALPG
mgnify:CR=1 FL=1